MTASEPLPWYCSRAVWGGIVSVLAGVAGLSLTAADQAQVADLLVALASAVGGAVAVYGRVRATRKIGVSP